MYRGGVLSDTDSMQTSARYEATRCAQSLREWGPLTLLVFRLLGLFGRVGILK